MADPSQGYTGWSRKVRQSADVVSSRMGDAGVLVHLQTNRIFEVNATGLRIWELAGDGRTLLEIEERLRRRIRGGAGTVGRKAAGSWSPSSRTKEYLKMPTTLSEREQRPGPRRGTQTGWWASGPKSVSSLHHMARDRRWRSSAHLRCR